jgi:lipoate-protein ligase B
MLPLRVIDLGRRGYAETLELQRRLCSERGAPDHGLDDLLLLVEHEPVITLGRMTRTSSLPIALNEIAQRGVGVHEVERGGDVTWHGPGQLVGYPIVDLRRMRADLHWYLRSLEDALIDALGSLGIPADRNPGYTGVWTAGRKIASLGVHVKRWVTLHGFALNVVNDLDDLRRRRARRQRGAGGPDRADAGRGGHVPGAGTRPRAAGEPVGRHRRCTVMTAPMPRIDVRTPAATRLPPGQIVTRKWPVLQYSDVPIIDTASWRFEVRGAVENPFILTWPEFVQLGHQETLCDMHCVTRWSRYDNLFEGVPVRTLLAIAHPAPHATHVLVHAEPGYTTNLSLDDLDREANLLATRHDGEVLTPEHGGPVRLLVPHRYLWKSAKWVTGFEFLDGDVPGFWEDNGYHMRGDPWQEERFGRPDPARMRRGPRR